MSERPRIALSQRVHRSPHGERWDALDQRWPLLLAQCGLEAVPIANRPELVAATLSSFEVRGVLLTGGNDLASLGGDAPERDATEELLVQHALRAQLPVLGVCRGMQLLQVRAGARLERVAGHVACSHAIQLAHATRQVNSYHGWASRETPRGYRVLARAQDGVVEAIEQREHALLGIMWHPEREEPFQAADLELLRAHFIRCVSPTLAIER